MFTSINKVAFSFEFISKMSMSSSKHQLTQNISSLGCFKHVNKFFKYYHISDYDYWNYSIKAKVFISSYLDILKHHK